MRTYHMPMPFGWFQVAWSDEVPIGTSKPLVAFDKHLAAWRDENGEAHVWDAFCPHLGAHFGYRAEIKGDAITCALHGWSYGPDGKVVDIPYSDRLNQKACVRTYPVVERNGILMAWYHPTDEPPAWEIPELPEFGEDSDFSEVFRKSYTLNCHWQEIAETQADAAHIQAHLVEYQTAMNGGVRPDKITMPQVDAYNTDGPIAEIRLTQNFPTPSGEVHGRIDTDVVGPGFAATWFTGLVDTLLVGCATPTGPGSCALHYSFVVRKTGGAESTSSLGRAFIEEIHERTIEDVVVWENKAYVPRPALAHGDGPIMKFRRWCEQFYFEGVDRSPELAVPELPGQTGALVDAH
jgi:phenylpropionate dioxygenase-like ring-hydroxylating dioxygenase large terminal subunit